MYQILGLSVIVGKQSRILDNSSPGPNATIFDFVDVVVVVEVV